MVFFIYVGSDPRGLAVSLVFLLASLLLGDHVNVVRSFPCLPALQAILLCVIAVGFLFLCFPDWLVEHLPPWLGERQQAAANWARRPVQTGRRKASRSVVSSLPVETFCDEEELLTWSATRLKDELRRLQRLADLRMQFTG